MKNLDNIRLAISLSITIVRAILYGIILSLMKYLPKTLLVIYLLVFLIAAMNPYDRAVWWAENIPVMIVVGVLVWLWMSGKMRFSRTAYGLMFVRIVMHTIGGHYTFERVPFEWFNNLFGFERNMYDRVGHYSIGFYAYPLAEYLYRKQLVKATWIHYMFPIAAIFALASIYEIFERWYAVTMGGSQGAAFLGSQGDIWDAQKDMLCDGLGAITAMVLFWLGKRRYTIVKKK
jgi:putative membrane protein